MNRHYVAAMIVPIIALGLTACGGGAAGDNAAASVYSKCDDKNLPGYLVRDGNRIRIVIAEDTKDIPSDKRTALVDMYTCIVGATGYGKTADDLRDGDTWGRWTYTEDSDGNITWTAAD